MLTIILPTRHCCCLPKGRQSLVALLSRGSPLRRSAHDSTPSSASTASPAAVQEEPEPSPLLLAKVSSLS